MAEKRGFKKLVSVVRGVAPHAISKAKEISKLKKLIKKADLDGDEEITYKDIPQFIKKRYEHFVKKYDQNSDGVFNKEDIKLMSKRVKRSFYLDVGKNVLIGAIIVYAFLEFDLLKLLIP